MCHNDRARDSALHVITKVAVELLPTIIRHSYKKGGVLFSVTDTIEVESMETYAYAAEIH